MKAVIFLAVLLFGFCYAKPHSQKRSQTCSGFPKEISGRLYQVVVMDSGTSITNDVHFNIDMNQHRVQADISSNGQSYTVYADFQNDQYYVVYQGGCLSSSGGDDAGLPDIPDFDEISNGFTPDASGKLGLNGASVDVYTFNHEGGSGIVTMEGGNQCIPVNYASKETGSASAGSFLDLKTSVAPWNIPEECTNSASVADLRRSLPGMVYHAHFKDVMKRGFPWVARSTKKRGFPWLSAPGFQKRGFPWLEK